MSLAGDVRWEIRLALALNNVSQAELARRLGLSKKHVNQMLTGKTAVSLDMAEQMLGAVGWTLLVSAREGSAERYRGTSPVSAQRASSLAVAGLSVQCTAHGDPVAMVHEDTLWRCPRWVEDDMPAGHVRWVSDDDVAETIAAGHTRLWWTVLVTAPAQG
jgi:transcriptional regulator with XRE-family HTH domain